MRTYFIFNNLKVHPFFLSDGPFPGFKLLTWDHESWTYGTLLDIGNDAGFTPIGHYKVFGQLWVADDMPKITELEDLLGVNRGFMEPVKVLVNIETDVKEKVDAITYRLKNIPSNYGIVEDGKWWIKTNKEMHK